VFLLSKAKDEVHRVALLWKTDREKQAKASKVQQRKLQHVCKFLVKPFMRSETARKCFFLSFKRVAVTMAKALQYDFNEDPFARF